MAEYLSIDLKEAKAEIIRIFFGGKPSCELPFLWKLKEEIDEAIDSILLLENFKNLQGYFNDRPNAKYSRFAYAIASKENEALNKIITEIELEVNAKPLCLIFDGVIIESRNEET